MNAIWKFPFEITDDFEIEMPMGAQILHVAMQREMPCIWAIVDPNAPKVTRKFHLSGTGHPLEESCTQYNHVGTFQMHDGALVFHLFWV